MNRSKVYLVTVNCNIEFKDGKFTGWDEQPSVLYGFNEMTEAKKRIWELRQEEVTEYKQWLKKEMSERKCFMHHHYDIKEIMVF